MRQFLVTFAAVLCAIVVAALGNSLLHVRFLSSRSTETELRTAQARLIRMQQLRDDLTAQGVKDQIDRDTLDEVQVKVDGELAAVVALEEQLISKYRHRWLPLWGSDKAQVKAWSEAVATYHTTHSAEPASVVTR